MSAGGRYYDGHVYLLYMVHNTWYSHTVVFMPPGKSVERHDALPAMPRLELIVEQFSTPPFWIWTIGKPKSVLQPARAFVKTAVNKLQRCFQRTASNGPFPSLSQMVKLSLP